MKGTDQVIEKNAIGNVLYCPQTHILKTVEGEVPLEPKVGEVLSYLASNPERYISLQELHENIWSGRIVTDTAVRKTISKLRAYLSTSSCEVKSLPRRGYRLICTEGIEEPKVVSELEYEGISGGAASLSVNDNASIYSRSTPSQASQKSPVPVFNRVFKKVIIPAVVAGVLIWFVNGGVNDLMSQAEKSHYTYSHTVIPTFQSEKQAVAVSSDSKSLIFSARKVESSGYQLYLKRSNSGSIKQLTHGNFNVIFVVFLEGDSEIAFIDYTQGKADLYRLLLNGESVPQKVVGGFKAMGALKKGVEPNTVLATIMEDESGGLVHSIDLNTAVIRPFTYSNVSPVIDYGLAASPSNSRLAYVRGTNAHSESQLHIMQVNDRHIIYRFQLDRVISSLSWEDEQNILALDDKELFRLNIETGKKTVILKNEQESFKRLISADNQRYLMLKETNAHGQLVEAQLSDKLSNFNYLSSKTGLLEGVYTNNPEQRLFIDKQQGEYMLTSVIGNKQEKIYRSAYPIEFLDHLPVSNQYLLKVNDELRLVSKGEEKVLTSELQYIGDAEFASNKAEKILHTELVLGRWVVKEHDVETNTSIEVAKGYRSFRQTQQGGVAANEKGELFLLDAQFQQLEPLNVTVAFDLGQSWDYANNTVVWTKTDTQHTELFKKNLITGEITEFKNAYTQMSPQVSLSSDGQSVLFLSSNINHSDIVSLSH